MNYTVHHEDSTTKLLMPAEATIETVGTLHALLLKSDSPAMETVVDLSETVTLDVTSLQVLCAAHHKATKEGRRLRLDNISTSARNAVTQLGYPRHIGCGHDVTGSCLWLVTSPS